MMQFLDDMGVNVRVVEWLRNNGHDAKHLREEELHRVPNGEIFLKAINENRIIITFDLDFGEIVALSKGEKVSVVLFRLHNTQTSHPPIIQSPEGYSHCIGRRGSSSNRRITVSCPPSSDRKKTSRDLVSPSGMVESLALRRSENRGNVNKVNMS